MKGERIRRRSHEAGRGHGHGHGHRRPRERPEKRRNGSLRKRIRDDHHKQTKKIQGHEYERIQSKISGKEAKS